MSNQKNMIHKIIKISKFQAEKELEHWSKEVSSKGMCSIRVYILNFVERMKTNVLRKGEPYEVISEENYNGFVSDELQIITTKDYVEYTVNGITTQVSFMELGMTEELSIAA